jgi:hypothetical protein
MHKLNQHITIYEGNSNTEKFRFPFVSTVEIISSKLNFTDTCTVILPQRIRQVNKKISDYIKIGDKILIKLGYYPELLPEFSGFVTKIKPNNEMVLECENDAFLYKLQSLNPVVLKDTNYDELIKTIYSGKYKTLTDPIGDCKIGKNVTLLEVLDEMRQKLGTIAYWQDGILFIDYEIIKEPSKTVEFNINENVPIGEDNLEILKPTQQENIYFDVISYGVSPQKDGTVIELYARYKDVPGSEIIVSDVKPSGNLNKFEIPGLTRDALEKLIKRRLPNLWYTGAVGEITTFGSPSLKHGDLAAIYDKNNKDRNGKYQILEVRKRFGVGIGFRQTVKLGQKIADYESDN